MFAQGLVFCRCWTRRLLAPIEDVGSLRVRNHNTYANEAIQGSPCRSQESLRSRRDSRRLSLPAGTPAAVVEKAGLNGTRFQSHKLGGLMALPEYVCVLENKAR